MSNPPFPSEGSYRTPPGGSSAWGEPRQQPMPPAADQPVPVPAPPVWGQAPQAALWDQPPAGAAPPSGPDMPYAPPPAAPAPARPSGPSRRSRATLALVLSFLGLFFCGPFALVGAWLARRDLDAMNHGETDPANRSRAVRAYGIGIGGTILWLVMIALWWFAATHGKPPV